MSEAKKSFRLSLVPLLVLGWGACSPPQPHGFELTVAESPPDWREALIELRAERQAGLSDPDGWRALVGLDWLEPGETTVGSALDRDVVLPTPNAPPSLGTFRVAEGSVVTFTAAPEAVVTVAGEVVSAEIPIATDADEDTTLLEAGPLELHVVRRAEQLALRTRDRAAPRLAEPPTLAFWPPREDWILQARFEPHTATDGGPRTLPILDVVGLVRDMESPGVLVFRPPGADPRAPPLRLDVLDGGEVDGEASFFVIFGDATNGRHGAGSYPAGRYLYVPRPASPNEPVVVDFNRAYNPPCAFTAFATCPLPPPGNKLAVAVEAGEQYEKSYGGWNQGSDDPGDDHHGADGTDPATEPAGEAAE